MTDGPVRGSSRWPSALLALCSLLLSLALLEFGFRLARFDFEFKARAFGKVPIFYRKPELPTGEAFYRRAGPALWEGRVITPMLEVFGVPARQRPAEAAVSVSYDERGFRNPPDLLDWEIVVVGDSMTELGQLAYRDLFTTRLAARLGVPVKNLGVSWTGPFSHAHYLREYGLAPGARHAVLAFFEGNDVQDLIREALDLEEAARRRRAGAAAPRRSRLERLEPQSSMLTAACRWGRATARAPRAASIPVVNATYRRGEERIPITVQYTPPGAAAFAGPARALLARALSEWAQAAGDAGMRPWLLYLPSKRRVLHGRLAFQPGMPEALVDWAPGGFRGLVRRLARQRGIGFVDATGALRREAEVGRLPFNAVWDSHLNRDGARVVADVLADALAGRGAR